MIEHGIIRIRRRIDEEKLKEKLKEIETKLDENHRMFNGPFFDEFGYKIGTASKNLHRVHYGNIISLIVCRNSKNRISLILVERRPEIDVKIVDMIVEELVDFTGGKFHERDI